MKDKILFNLIAPIYGLFYNYQRRLFQNTISAAKSTIDISKFSSVLDVGCGTGALCSVLNDLGLKVTGVDPAYNMIEIARKKDKNNEINFEVFNKDGKLPFADKSFDLVMSSYVLHGIKSDERILLYKEMMRISRNFVIIQDYNDERALLTNIIEYLEGGDYFNFIKFGKKEMESIFSKVDMITFGVRTAWYICIPI